MIPHQWYVVLESRQVGKKPIGVVRLGEKMVFWRDETGRVVCFRDRCVHRGVQLSQGQVIGLVGGTGRVTGAHLHWEVWVNGVQVNPLDWLQKAFPH